MNHQTIINQLEQNEAVITSLVEGISPDQAVWRPTEDTWSIVEVINHLYDEEREDFRQCITLALTNDKATWPPIQPDKWVIERNYQARELNRSVTNFVIERKKSIVWLNSLESPNWQATLNHPHLGPMSAEQLLANWLAHDFLHIRQLNELRYLYLAQLVSPMSLRYAGQW